MKVRNFLAGVLLGTGLTLGAAWQHHGAKVDELKAAQKTELENVHYAYQENLKRAWEYATEECPELFERNIELEVAVIQLEGKVIQEQLNCLWKLQRAEKERCQ